jgi:hypothetical protein
MTMMIRSGWWAAAVIALWTLGGCDQEPPSAAPPAAAVPEDPPGSGPVEEEPIPTSKLSVLERELMFGEILRIYREWWLMPGKCGTPNPWLSQEEGTHHTEGRLFARVYPDLAERLALEVLRDPEAPDPDRAYAWFILGILPPRPNPALEQFLVEKASVDEVYEAGMALSCLARRRFDEIVLKLCRLQARRGGYVAFDLLSQTVDAESIKLLKELTTWSDEHPHPIGGIPSSAESALKRISILQRGDWEAQLQRLLLDRTSDDFYDPTPWAISVAKRRGMASLKATLETRLNKARERGEPVRPSVSYPEDFDIDLVLVAYAEAGGVLRSEEHAYLSEHGIIGRSEERLQMVLRHYLRPRRR